MKQRIYGLETEYAIIHYPSAEAIAQDRILSEADIFEMISSHMSKHNYVRLSETQFHLDRIGSRVIRPHERVNSVALTSVQDRMFLGNGARFYLDTGGHPEYATPECLDPYQLVVYDKAGETLISHLVSEIEQTMIEHGYTGNIFVCKNNVDIRGNTYGCHENYLMERRRTFFDETNFFRQIVGKLIPFLVTRQIFAGAGKIHSGERIQFQISQRSDYIDAEISSATTSRRGIVNAKDEPLSHRERFRRLHLIVGDSNMSEISTYLKIGTTGLVLRMIEEGWIEPDLSLSDPVLAIKKISRDLNFREKLPLRNGREYTPLDIQRIYLSSAKRFYREFPRELGSEEKRILLLWEEALAGLEGKHKGLEPELDWCIKKKILDRYLAKNDSSFDELGIWSFFIRKIKSFRIEPEIARLMRKRDDFDLRQFLSARLSQIDFIQLDRYVRETHIDLEDYGRMRRLYHGLVERDLRYHDVNQKSGFYFLYKSQGLMRKFLGKSLTKDIRQARDYPPPNTRAKIRGDFVRRMNAIKMRGGVRWDAVYIYVDRMKKIDLLDPFQSTHIPLEKNLKQLEDKYRENQDEIKRLELTVPEE